MADALSPTWWPWKNRSRSGRPRTRLLAKMIPIRRRQAVPKDEVLAIFATAPVIDTDELRADLDALAAQDLRDPYGGTGL